MKPPATVWDIKRNDLYACEYYYRRNGVTPDEVAVMIQLQDDPKELLEAMKTWKTKR